MCVLWRNAGGDGKKANPIKNHAARILVHIKNEH
jgi:hypothetical protein